VIVNTQLTFCEGYVFDQSNIRKPSPEQTKTDCTILNTVFVMELSRFKENQYLVATGGLVWMTENDMKVSQKEWITKNKTLEHYQKIVDKAQQVLKDSVIDVYNQYTHLSSSQGKEMLNTCERVLALLKQEPVDN
jgi:hypothetical protein